MNNLMSSAILLLIIALAHVSASADGVIVSDVQMTAFASFTTQHQPEKTDFDAKTFPPGTPNGVEAFVSAGGLTQPFPNLPTTQTQAFASSAASADNFYGVGVNGFFFPSALPPHNLEASGTFLQNVINNSAVAESLSIDFLIPGPTIQFVGQVGNNFPVGADPARDVTANVSVRMLTTLTRPDGSSVETVHVDYGMRTFRDPAGVLNVLLSRDATGLTRFEDIGFFSFQLPDLERNDFDLGLIGPGDTLTFSYDYFAQASTGFGEIGIFAAIGDPFNLSTGGGRFNIQVGDSSLPPSAVPEPTTMLLLSTGLAGIGAFHKKRQNKRAK
ncbi:MAG TPA: PEP-CTERM sorting domain-containing protein [Pyrinomonadaceae bacterium]|nr:PEP-CTERM sorting domain-containing protein [Pyrinomonadaceae bacterium]